MIEKNIKGNQNKNLILLKICISFQTPKTSIELTSPRQWAYHKNNLFIQLNPPNISLFLNPPSISKSNSEFFSNDIKIGQREKNQNQLTNLFLMPTFTLFPPIPNACSTFKLDTLNSLRLCVIYSHSLRSYCFSFSKYFCGNSTILSQVSAQIFSFL